MNFYHLGPPEPGPSIYGKLAWASQYGFVERSPGLPVETIECSKNSFHRRSGKRIGDLRVVLPSARIGSFAWTWYGECLVTSEVLSGFQERGFTGFEVGPVTVERIKRKGIIRAESLPTLNEIRVVGKGGEAHPDAGIHLLRSCDVCGFRRYSSYRNGIIVDETAWDGRDFFVVSPYPGFILVSERVKEYIVAQALTNCSLTPSHLLQWSDAVVRPEESEAIKRL